jgi:hypothetical protein
MKPKTWSGTGGPFEWLQFVSQFKASLHPKELEYLKERNTTLIQSIKIVMSNPKRNGIS